jgi:hypothetical protein
VVLFSKIWSGGSGNTVDDEGAPMSAVGTAQRPDLGRGIEATGSLRQATKIDLATD